MFASLEIIPEEKIPTFSFFMNNVRICKSSSTADTMKVITAQNLEYDVQLLML
jgi:hypothetical protein